jgi:hypothetical protein
VKMECHYCDGPMIPLLTSFVCKDECDLEPFDIRAAYRRSFNEWMAGRTIRASVDQIRAGMDAADAACARRRAEEGARRAAALSQQPSRAILPKGL